MEIRKSASRLLFVFALVLCAAVSRVALQASGGPGRVVFTEPFDIIVGAGEGCSGEDVHVFGPLEIRIQTTVDGRGNTHTRFHLTPHLTGIGLTTGDTYNPVGPSNTYELADGNGPRVASGINIINLISPGPQGNLILRESFHLTVTPDGTVIVDTYELRGGCKG